MRKWLALGLLLLAGAVEAQPVSGGLLGRGASYSSFVTPTGCTTGSVATFLGSLTCVPGLTYAGGTLSVPGAVSAQNLNAIPLPAAGAVTVTPKLSPLGGITVVAGSALVDGDALSVGDGVGVVPIEFDAAPGDGTTGGAVAIVFDGTETATEIRDAVKTILDGAGRDWTTSNQGADGIGLIRATPGASGGAITESVADAGFTVNDWTAPTAATTYTYSLQACTAGGACTAAGAASSTAAGVLTLSAYNPNRLSWSAVTGAASYKIRRDVGGATQGVIWSGTALTVDDTGLAGDSTAKPTVDGTGVVTAAKFVATVPAAALATPLVMGDWTWQTTSNGLSFYLSTRAGGTTPSNTVYGNTAIGHHALFNNTTGGDNTCIGSFTGPLLTTGQYNTFIGADAGGRLTDQNNAVGIGKTALWGLTGEANVGVGTNALYSPTQAASTYNTAIGHQAGYSVAGNRNVFIGPHAGYYHTGGAKLFIDAPSTYAAGASNFPLIGGDFDANTVGLRGSVTVISPTTLAGETLTNGALTSGTSWNVTGGYALTGNTAVYTHAAGTGTLFQESADLAIKASTTRDEWYVLTYVASGATGDAAAALQTWITVVTPLSVATGTHTVYLLAPAGSARFTINATSTSGGFTLDTLSLKRVTGGDLYVNRDLTVARAVKGSAVKAITDGSATAFATFTIADGASYSGEVFYSVKAAKATARQVLHGRVSFTATREGSTYTAVAGTTQEALTQTLAAAAGTLTGGVTIACTGGVCTFSATFDTSQATPDSFAINYRIDSPDAGLTVTDLR